MNFTDEISPVGQRLESKQSDWNEDSVTLVDEPHLLKVRKLEAAPADDLEEIEDLRGQLHATVDHLVNRALDSVGELRAIVARSERVQESLSAELDCVIRHSNAMVRASVRKSTPPPPPPRRRRSTLIEFPTDCAAQSARS